MKSVKLASLLLASGMLLGTVHTAVTPAYTAHAADSSVLPRNQVPVELDETNTVINQDTDGNWIIVGLNMSSDKLTELFSGAKLIIPETINGDVISGIGDNAFNKADYPSVSDLDGIADLTFENASNITYIGNSAFKGNEIGGELNLPEVLSIGSNAFVGNQLTSVDLSKVSTIGDNAFYDNELTSVDLPNVLDIGADAFNDNSISGELELEKATAIGNRAFMNNKLTSVKLLKVLTITGGAFAFNSINLIELNENVIFNPGASGMHYNPFGNQNIELEKEANSQGKVPFSALAPTVKMGDEDLKAIVLDVMESNQPETFSNTNYEIDDGARTINLVNKNQSALVNLVVEVDFKHADGAWSGLWGYSINPMKLTIKANTTGDTGSNTSTTPDTTTPETSTPDTNTPGTNTPETPIVISPDPDVNRPHTVYAKRAMRLHSNVSLTSPTKSYKKQSRAKAPSFRVLGISYDQNGKKRYKVKGGYITASTKYVADSHFRSSKVKQVRVIGNRVNSYKNVKLSKSQKVRSYKKGSKIKVKRIVKYGRTTRFQLPNGRYISGNKQLLIMDHRK